MSFRLRLFKWKDHDPKLTPGVPRPAEYQANVEEVNWPEDGTVPPISEAPLVSSRIDQLGDMADESTHLVLLDIDYPVRVIESSPGRSHLVIEKAVTWPQLRLLLTAMENAGIVEHGYATACIIDNCTFLRRHDTTPVMFNKITGMKPEDVYHKHPNGWVPVATPGLDLPL